MRIGLLMVSMGEQTESLAIKTARRQKRKPDRFVIVRGVSPISSACNKGYGLLKDCDYVAEMGSDFILEPETLGTLVSNLKPGDGQLYGKLWDTYRRIMIDSMMIYNRKAVEEVGFYRDVPRCDVDLGERLRGAGWKTRQIDCCFGLHMSQHTAMKRFMVRQWNGGKGVGLGDLAHGTKASLISFSRTHRARWLVAPFLMASGRILGKKEDVRG